MDRRSLLKNAGLAGVLAAGAAPAIVGAQPALRWRLASGFPRALDTIFGAAEVFAKSVSDATGGRFQVSVHPAGELMPAGGVFDGVQAGTIECAHTASYFFFGKDDAFALGTAIPFGMNGRQTTAWFYDGNGLKLLRELFDPYNIVNFPAGNTGAQMGGWFRKEIKSLEDFRGLKFRIGGFAGRIMARLGAVPQMIPAGEIYLALERGTVDGAEFVGPYDDEKLGFQRVAPFYYYPGFWEGGAQLDLFVNKKAYHALSAEYKAIVEAAASHAHVTMLARYDARNPAALKRLVAGGTKLEVFPRAVMDAAFREAMAMHAELSKTNPRWKKIYDDYSAFRRDANLWFRLSEARFDDYMQVARL